MNSIEKTVAEKEQSIKRIDDVLRKLQGLIWIGFGLFELYRHFK